MDNAEIEIFREYQYYCQRANNLPKGNERAACFGCAGGLLKAFTLINYGHYPERKAIAKSIIRHRYK
jgi:hypothetical protein